MFDNKQQKEKTTHLTTQFPFICNCNGNGNQSENTINVCFALTTTELLLNIK